MQEIDSVTVYVCGEIVTAVPSASRVFLAYSATGLHCLYAPQLVAPSRLKRSESANTVRARSSQGCVSHSNSCLRKANARLDPFSCHKTGLKKILW